MKLWGWKSRGRQTLKMEHDEMALPISYTPKHHKGWPWLMPLICTMLLAASTVSFRMRLYRGITHAPIDLPLREYAFTDHPELRPFDKATSELWQPFGEDHWWSMEWRDQSGNHLVQGIDMLHKLHCLVSIRYEFTMMATDPDRRVFFNAHTAESITRKMHVQHCFDFIRQDILCGADATVEPLGPGYTRSNGLGVSHQCRDWEKVIRYAQSNTYYPEQLKGLK